MSSWASWIKFKLVSATATEASFAWHCQQRTAHSNQMLEGLTGPAQDFNPFSRLLFDAATVEPCLTYQ